MTERTEAYNPPWLFGLLGLPGGIAGAVITVLAPFLLREYKVPVDRIANIVVIASLPNMWYFLYSPIVDLGHSRRRWIFGSAVIAAVLAAAAILAVPRSLSAVAVLLFASNAVASLISSANGALLSELPGTARGSASGWYQAANLGGGVIGGGIAIWLVPRTSLLGLATAVVALIVLPAIGVRLAKEAPLPDHPLKEMFGKLFHDAREVLWSRPTLIALIFFLSPVSCAAVGNLISGLGPDYHAPDGEVVLISGIAGGLLNAFGSFVGGKLADRMNRMYAYAACGPIAAAFALYLGFGPLDKWTYGVGYAGYAIAAGVGYAVFTALVLDVIGNRRHGAATAYSVLVSSGNVPIAYMTWLDGRGYKAGAIRGLMGVDALGNALGAAVLFAVAAWAKRRASSDALKA